jgi:DNA mismatch repair protein MutS
MDSSTPDLTGIRTTQSQIKNADYRELDRTKLSPMYQHYVEVKEQYPHALLLYRCGDFFETFFQDAITIARELELVLTSKEGGREIGRVPMTGVPHHAVDRYCAMLVEKGYAIAMCDQVEDAADAVGLVKREIVRVLTPGTIQEDNMLQSRRNNFLAAIVIVNENWGLAYADISTGEFFASQSNDLEVLGQELVRLQAAEVLFPTSAPDLNRILRPGEKSELIPAQLPTQLCYSMRQAAAFALGEAKQRLLDKFQIRSLESLGCESFPLAVRAAGGLLEYLDATQKDAQIALQPLRTYAVGDYMILDDRSRRNLEIVQTVRDGLFQGSLLSVIDRTRTAMGGRALRRWVLQPLLDIYAIDKRQETIQELVTDNFLCQDIQKLLRQIYDIERLTGKAASGRANAKDLVAIADSLLKLPDLAALVQRGKSPFLKVLHQVPEDLELLGQKIAGCLVENPPHQIKEGGLIRPGIDGQLDEMRSLAAGDRDWVAQLETLERERTGIANLKVGYNKTFGYYISISRLKADLVPEDYIRKQTLTNEERYITPELKEREVRILTAQDDIDRLEYELFLALRTAVAERAELIRTIARSISALDVLCGLAELAIERGYCRPQLTRDRQIEITDGRHPVVEHNLIAGFFVPNSTHLGYDAAEENNIPDLIVLTGPNASGKSCYLRQVGLIHIMAQIGSFIPATDAKLGICDRIFTRVGAVDDLASGQSTFMVEMNETANILNHATPNSLVLLDEIGRGTATFDGLSIAWAVSEYLANEVKSRTIFATHYHELNELASLLNNVANYQVTVKELPNEIIFLHQVKPGGASKSYGIEAGRLAGLPATVIDRAQQVMSQIEQHSKIAIGLRESMS